MDRLMQANLQIIELLGVVFEEVERHDARHSASRRAPAEASMRLRSWVGKASQTDGEAPSSRANGMN